MRFSSLCGVLLVLAMSSAASAQMGLARLSAAASGDPGAFRAWKHELDVSNRKDIAERAERRAANVSTGRRITLESAPQRAAPMRVSVSGAGEIEHPALNRDPMSSGPAGRATSKKAPSAKPQRVPIPKPVTRKKTGG